MPAARSPSTVPAAHAAVAFDVSHLGTVRVTGPDALERLQLALTNDLGKIGPGRAQYTHLLDENDASVLDDIIVWWVDDDRFDVMPNASNTSRVREALGVGEDADVTAERAVIAVQGPAARERLATVWPEAAAVGRFRVAPVEWNGVACVVAGTGYTGEDGVELAVPAAQAPEVWEAVTGAGVEPAGLGARDTLRLEAGLPLHGHELGPGHHVAAGRTRLGRELGQGPVPRARRARRRARAGRAAAAAGHRHRGPPSASGRAAIVLVDGQAAGEVTSGNFSPMLGHGIALGVPAARRRRGHRGRRSRSALAKPSPAPSSPPRSGVAPD